MAGLRLYERPGHAAALAAALEKFDDRGRLDAAAWRALNGRAPSRRDPLAETEIAFEVWAEWLAEELPGAYAAAPLPAAPTEFPPRSLGKELALMARAARREALFRPDDAPLGDRRGLAPDGTPSPDALAAFVGAIMEERGGGPHVLELRPARARRQRTAREKERARLERAAEAKRKRLARKRRAA